MDRHHLLTERLELHPTIMADAERLAVFHADSRIMNLLQLGARRPLGLLDCVVALTAR